jgi:hypothetical protein
LAGAAFLAAGAFFAAGTFFAGAFLAATLLVFLADFLAAGVAADFVAALADEDVVTVFSVFALVFLAGRALVAEEFFAVWEAFLSVAFFPPGRRRVIARRGDPVAGFTGTINLTNR